MDASHRRFHVPAGLCGSGWNVRNIFAEQCPLPPEEVFDDEHRRVKGQRLCFRDGLPGRYDTLSRELVDQVCSRRQLPFPVQMASCTLRHLETDRLDGRREAYSLSG